MRRFVVTTLFVVLAGPAVAQDVDAGLALSQQWCNACHSIGDEEERMHDAGPLWSELAEQDDDYLLGAINAPHDFMPDFPSLTDEDKANIVAYIQSLRDG